MKDHYKNKGMKLYTPLVLMAEFLLRPLFRRRPHILVACHKKSGSTWLTNMIAAHEGLDKLRLVPAWGRREQELCEIQLLRYNHRAYVAQQHVCNSEWLQELSKRYGLRRVVLVRNFFDIIVSTRDHVRREGGIAPGMALDPPHLEMPDHVLDDFIARHSLPWMTSFYVGWRRDPQALLVRYEELIADPAATLRKIFDFSGIATNDAKIAAAIKGAEGRANRFNKGISGRGMMLSPGTREMILDFLSHYPDIADDPLIKEMAVQHASAMGASSGAG